MEYIKLFADDITENFLDGFHHVQKWTRQFVFIDGSLELKDVLKERVWNNEKRIMLSNYLRSTVDEGGVVLGAFDGGVLVAFCAIEGEILGKENKYANLSMLFVDDRYKRVGIGTTLLSLIREEAKKLGAEKIFISSIPSFETVSFYLSNKAESTCGRNLAGVFCKVI